MEQQQQSSNIKIHDHEINNKVLVNVEDKEKHWNVLDRIKRKFEEDAHLRKIFYCINHYNNKHKKTPLTFVMIIQYLREDEVGNKLALVDRYKYTLFTTSTPRYTTRLDGGKTSDIPIHIQLLIGRITGYEVNDKLDHIISDIGDMPLPSNNMYKKIENSGLFNKDICYTGIIGSEGNYQPIPEKFTGLR